MKVYATFNQEVQIEPKEVIKKLLEQEIGTEHFNWIVEREGKFYHIHVESEQSHTFDVADEISPEKYEYVRALQLVLKRLELNCS